MNTLIQAIIAASAGLLPISAGILSLVTALISLAHTRSIDKKANSGKQDLIRNHREKSLEEEIARMLKEISQLEQLLQQNSDQMHIEMADTTLCQSKTLDSMSPDEMDEEYIRLITENIEMLKKLLQERANAIAQEQNKQICSTPSNDNDSIQE